MNNFPFTINDCSCNIHDENISLFRCTGTPCLWTPGMRIITQKIIQNQVRIPESQYINVLSASTIQGGKNNLPLPIFNNVNENQASDRNILHIQTRYVPGSGANSTKTSITRLRPGSIGPAGIGVDIKHNSYNRYLGRLKAKSLGSSWSKNNNPNILLPITAGPPPYYTPSQKSNFDRFSNIKYGILGDGLCNICIK